MSTSGTSSGSGATGCVERRRSATIALGLWVTWKPTQVPANPAASSLTRNPMYSAKDSLSQMSSHQVWVTRSPNHMCDISCAITIARVRRSTSVTRPRGRNSSRKVTQPGFSIAPQLSSGTRTWS